jgi:hypothetical protein
MKPPNESGAHVAADAALCVKPNRPKSDCLQEIVKAPDLEQLARAYAAAADAEHEAKLARLEARDRLLERVQPGFEFEGVRVLERNSWRLTPEASAKLATTRAELIEAGQAERVSIVVAYRIGREEE